ncbi:MAG: thioredoxin family protein [Ferruginibacter sp.]
MKKLIVIAFCLASVVTHAQTDVAKLYNPEANAKKDIKAAVKKARSENKYVLIHAGGNWCTWCFEFVKFCNADPQIDSVLKSSFVIYYLNTDKDNKNEKTFAKYGYPQRFGFPVFIILDQKGNRIHTQHSVYFENDKKSYDKTKVLEFLELWSPRALDPKNYVE